MPDDLVTVTVPRDRLDAARASREAWLAQLPDGADYEQAARRYAMDRQRLADAALSSPPVEASEDAAWDVATADAALNAARMAGYRGGPVEEREAARTRANLLESLATLRAEVARLRGAGTDATSEALWLVREERARQNAKWGRKPGEWPDNDGTKLAVLLEEVGEVGRELLESGVIHRGEPPRPNLRAELVQVAAVAVSWIEALTTEVPRG